MKLKKSSSVRLGSQVRVNKRESPYHDRTGVVVTVVNRGKDTFYTVNFGPNINVPLKNDEIEVE